MLKSFPKSVSALSAVAVLSACAADPYVDQQSRSYDIAGRPLAVTYHQDLWDPVSTADPAISVTPWNTGFLVTASDSVPLSEGDRSIAAQAMGAYCSDFELAFGDIAGRYRPLDSSWYFGGCG